MHKDSPWSGQKTTLWRCFQFQDLTCTSQQGLDKGVPIHIKSMTCVLIERYIQVLWTPLFGQWCLQKASRLLRLPISRWDTLVLLEESSISLTSKLKYMLTQYRGDHSATINIWRSNVTMQYLSIVSGTFTLVQPKQGYNVLGQWISQKITRYQLDIYSDRLWVSRLPEHAIIVDVLV